MVSQCSLDLKMQQLSSGGTAPSQRSVCSCHRRRFDGRFCPAAGQSTDYVTFRPAELSTLNQNEWMLWLGKLQPLQAIVRHAHRCRRHQRLCCRVCRGREQSANALDLHCGCVGGRGSGRQPITTCCSSRHGAHGRAPTKPTLLLRSRGPAHLHLHRRGLPLVRPPLAAPRMCPHDTSPATKRDTK